MYNRGATHTARQMYTSMHHNPRATHMPDVYGQIMHHYPLGNTYSQADVHQYESRLTGQHTPPGRHTHLWITTHGQHTQPGTGMHHYPRATHTAWHRHASRPTGNTHSLAPACITTHGQHTQPGTGMHHDPRACTHTHSRHMYIGMHHDPRGNTHNQADVYWQASRPTGQHTQPGRRILACITTHGATHTARQTYTGMHHDPRGNTHSQADVYWHASRPTGQHSQPGTSVHHDPHGEPHMYAQPGRHTSMHCDRPIHVGAIEGVRSIVVSSKQLLKGPRTWE